MTDPQSTSSPRTVAFAFLDLGDGGAQRLTLVAARHLDPARYRPVVLCVRGGGSLVASAVRSGLPVHALGRLRRPLDLAAVPILARWLVAAQVDVVHVPLYSRATPYVRLAGHLARRPLVVGHEWCRPVPPRAARRLADRALSHTGRFVAASYAQARELMAAGVEPQRIAVVYLGIEVDRFAPAPPGPARAALGLPTDRPIALVPARLHPMKGHVDLLAAVSILRRRVPNVLVLCAGDGPLRDALPALARSAGLDGNVRFLGQRADVAALYAACDVVALASHIEGLPSVAMEAFAAGRPVVATAVGGVSEVVSDGETGWLVTPRRPDERASALADALASALTRPDVAAARAARGRRSVLQRFQADEGALRLQAVYDRWLATGRRPSDRLEPGAPVTASASGGPA